MITPVIHVFSAIDRGYAATPFITTALVLVAHLVFPPEGTVAGALGAVDSGMVPSPKSASHQPQNPSIRASWERDGKVKVKFKPRKKFLAVHVDRVKRGYNLL